VTVVFESRNLTDQLIGFYVLSVNYTPQHVKRDFSRDQPFVWITKSLVFVVLPDPSRVNCWILSSACSLLIEVDMHPQTVLALVHVHLIFFTFECRQESVECGNGSFRQSDITRM
jgi:hypothetical protein